MNVIKHCLVFCLLTGFAYSQDVESGNNDTSDDLVNHGEKLLSRRKRFLIFPEGSSVQLVFCNTFPTIFAIGDIFLFGYTAALAYELPQDPYSPFDHHADPLHRRMDVKTIYYTNEDGNIISQRPYQRKFIVNPAFAKRSVDSAIAFSTGNTGADATYDFKKGSEFKIDRKQMHASKHTREFLNSGDSHLDNVEFHRTARSELYGKIETLLKGLGRNGKHCMLRTLCLVGQSKNAPQGDFLQEILRAVFTLPKGRDNEYLEEYDRAHSTTEPCEELYPDCDEPMSDITPGTGQLLETF